MISSTRLVLQPTKDISADQMQPTRPYALCLRITCMLRPGVARLRSNYIRVDQAHEPWLYWRGESYLPNARCPEILVWYMPPEPSAVYLMKKVLLRMPYQPNQRDHRFA